MPVISRKDLFNYASTDTKPTSVPAHSRLIESDTGNEYEFTGSTWVQVGTAGSSYTNLKGGTLDNGPYLELGYQPSAVTITASASGTILFTSTEITAFNGLVVEVVSISGTTAQLNAFPSVDGTNYAATALGWVNLQTNAVISGVTGLIGVGIYALIYPIGGRVKFKALRMTQTGGAADQASSIRYAHFWA